MSYEKFLRDKLIKKQSPDFKQIEYQLKRAQKDLKTAESNLPIDLTWAFAIAYHAMMRASKALMYSKGYLPNADDYVLGRIPVKSTWDIVYFEKVFSSGKLSFTERAKETIKSSTKAIFGAGRYDKIRARMLKAGN